MAQRINIGITMGDPAGVGPEIIAKAVSTEEVNRLGNILIIGDRWVFDSVNNEKAKIGSSKYIDSALLQFIDLRNVPRRSFRFGRMKKESGRAAMEYLKEAVRLIRNGQIDCLVTAPISKEAINLAGYRYNGHTEFLAEALGKKAYDLTMMLLNRYLKICLVTRHLPLSKVSRMLNEELIYKTIVVTHDALVNFFAIRKPKICVAALNPHAGEGGMLGSEEMDKIIPAVKRAAKLIGQISGPLPADVAFHYAREGHFSAIVAMYHDQALIPLKVTDFNSGVNLTLGLDVVRTSPLHGTGFDIAGRNIANCVSLTSAVKTAVECLRNLRRIKGASRR